MTLEEFAALKESANARLEESRNRVYAAAQQRRTAKDAYQAAMQAHVEASSDYAEACQSASELNERWTRACPIVWDGGVEISDTSDTDWQ